MSGSADTDRDVARAVRAKFLNGLKQFKALSRLERRALLAAFFLLPTTGLLVQLSGVAATRRVLGWLGSTDLARIDTDSVNEAQHIARVVGIAARRGAVRARCLEKSLVLESMLRRRGIGCELKFGVREGDVPLAAHAWVESGGQALADPGSEGRMMRVLG